MEDFRFEPTLNSIAASLNAYVREYRDDVREIKGVARDHEARIRGMEKCTSDLSRDRAWIRYLAVTAVGALVVAGIALLN